MNRLLFSFVFFSLFVVLGTVQAYVLGFKSADNSIGNIEAIEANHDVYLPIVSVIFDQWSEEEMRTVSNFASMLGRERVYHITLSPQKYTARQVALGYYDTAYRELFRLIKKHDLLVVFRTMHEMNGGRYPWASDPKFFQQAWRHVWEISREEGLDTRNILFSFSVNHRDAPTHEQNIDKQSELVFCTPVHREETGCFAFEDYYPGDTYVDLMGVSFYNWGKATYYRKWLEPRQILEDPEWETLSRLQRYSKPIILDEVATTAVDYKGYYRSEKSLEVYTNEYAAKNMWLKQLQMLLIEEKSIVAAVYFNADYTKGLIRAPAGEADWAAINVHPQKVYYGIYDLLDHNTPLAESSLLRLFGLQYVEGQRVVFEDAKFVSKFVSFLQKKYPDAQGRLNFLSAFERKVVGKTGLSEQHKRVWQRRIEKVREIVD